MRFSSVAALYDRRLMNTLVRSFSVATMLCYKVASEKVVGLTTICKLLIAVQNVDLLQPRAV